MPIYDVLHSEECMLFRNELRSVLQASGLTQTEVSKQLNQSQSYISKCLLGERRIGVIELYQICRVVNVSISEFISVLEPQWDELATNATKFLNAVNENNKRSQVTGENGDE